MAIVLECRHHHLLQLGGVQEANIRWYLATMEWGQLNALVSSPWPFRWSIGKKPNLATSLLPSSCGHNVLLSFFAATWVGLPMERCFSARCPPIRPLAVGSCLHVGPSSRSRWAGICVGAPCNRTSIACNLCALACTCSRQHHLARPHTTSCSCNRISHCRKPCRHIGSWLCFESFSLGLSFHRTWSSTQPRGQSGAAGCNRQWWCWIIICHAMRRTLTDFTQIVKLDYMSRYGTAHCQSETHELHKSCEAELCRAMRRTQWLTTHWAQDSTQQTNATSNGKHKTTLCQSMTLALRGRHEAADSEVESWRYLRDRAEARFHKACRLSKTFMHD